MMTEGQGKHTPAMHMPKTPTTLMTWKLQIFSLTERDIGLKMLEFGPMSFYDHVYHNLLILLLTESTLKTFLYGGQGNLFD